MVSYYPGSNTENRVPLETWPLSQTPLGSLQLMGPSNNTSYLYNQLNSHTPLPVTAANDTIGNRRGSVKCDEDLPSQKLDQYRTEEDIFFLRYREKK